MEENRSRANRRRRKKRRKKIIRRLVVAVIFLLAVVIAVVLWMNSSRQVEEGVEFLSQGNYEQAEAKFLEAIEKDKSPDEAYRGLGMALWEQQDYEGAKDVFFNALENDAEPTGTIYNFLGNCESELGNWEEAIQYYEKGIVSEDCSDDMMQEMLFNEIAAYEKLGDYESAKVKLEAYTEKYPDDEKAAKEAEFLETR